MGKCTLSTLLKRVCDGFNKDQQKPAVLSEEEKIGGQEEVGFEEKTEPYEKEEVSRLEELIIRHEGFELKPYRDTVGKLTIGVGRNLDDVGIHPDEASLMLKNDIERCRVEASEFVWFENLDEKRKMVIISMLFNLGLTRFLGFKKMIAALELNNFDRAAAEMLDSKWAVQVGKRAEELSAMMRYGSQDGGEKHGIS